MAPKQHEKLQLIADLDRSRLVLKQDLQSTTDGLNFPARFKASVLDAPLRWMLGAVAVGVVVGGIFRGSSKSRIKTRQIEVLTKRPPIPAPATPPPPPHAPAFFSGMAMELMKFSFLAAKPLLLAYATSKAAEIAAQLRMRDKHRRKK